MCVTQTDIQTARVSLLTNCYIIIFLRFINSNRVCFKTHRQQLLIRSVCLSVCHYREPCKNEWTDQDVVWDVDTVRSRNNVLDKRTDEGTILRAKSGRPSTCRTHQVVSILKAIQQGAALVWYRRRLGCTRWGAHWCNLVNTTEPFVCGGEAALRQISMNTCYYYC